MDVWTDVQTPPVFYRTSSPFGAAALLTRKATIDKSLSRARVPQIISCLWATGCIVITLCRVHDSYGAFTTLPLGSLTVKPKPVKSVISDGEAVLSDPSKMESFVGALEICNELASALNGAQSEQIANGSREMF